MARLETENLREFDPNVLPSGCRIPRYIFDHLFHKNVYHLLVWKWEQEKEILLSG